MKKYYDPKDKRMETAAQMKREGEKVPRHKGKTHKGIPATHAPYMGKSKHRIA